VKKDDNSSDRRAMIIVLIVAFSLIVAYASAYHDLIFSSHGKVREFKNI
jgi:hypothetical protein